MRKTANRNKKPVRKTVTIADKTPDYTEFNINDHVWVQLTPTGKRQLRANYDRRARMCECYLGYAHWPFPFTLPPEDAAGWSRWQLWDLMHKLGEYVGMGVDLPFKTTIRISKGR